MTYTFSLQPGIRERHLQRRYNNPLFPIEQRDFNQQDLTGACFMDEQDQQTFAIEFHNLVEEVANLKANEDSEKMLELKSHLDQSYEQCCALGGDNDIEKEAITQLVSIIMSAVWQSASGDAEAEANLKEEELARTTHYRLLQFPIVVDLLRPKSPIKENDLVPSLLSETEEALNAAFYLFDKQQQQSLYQQSVNLLDQRLQDKQDLPQAWKCLKLMKQLIDETI